MFWLCAIGVGNGCAKTLFICFVYYLFVMVDNYRKDVTHVNELSNSQYNDDDYISSIEQYRNEPWYDYLLTNPWMISKHEDFAPTLMQQIGENFGDMSARTSYYENLRSERQNWLSEFVEKMRQQDYNSPIEQVKREKSAGINSDLAPQNISPGNAAENDQPANSLPWPTESDTDKVISGAFGFLNLLVNGAQTFQNLKLGSLELVSKEIDNNSSARDFVLNQIAGSSFFSKDGNWDSKDVDNLGSDDIINIASKVDYSGYSRKTKKLIKRMFNRYADDLRSRRSPMAVEDLKAELRKRIAQNNSAAVGSAGHPLYSEDFDVFLRNFAKIIGKSEYDLQLLEFKTRGAELGSRSAKADFDTHYFHGLDADAAAAATNSENTAKSTKSSQDAIVESMWNEVYTLCKNEHSWYGTLGLLLIPMFRSIVNNTKVGFAGGISASHRF